MYQTLTKESLEEAMSGLMTQPQPRDMIIYTGLKGMQIINESIKKMADDMSRDAVRKEALVQLGIISGYGLLDVDEIRGLTAMINSDNPEDINVAVMLMEAKLNNKDGSNI